MSFRRRTTVHFSGSTPVFSMASRTLENGVLEEFSQNMSEVKMPDVELFDLDANLKAGVNLKEVSSKILHSNSFGVPILTESDTESENESENKENE